MTPEELLEGNKSIAIFMGYQYFAHNHPRIMGQGGRLFPAGWKTTPRTQSLGKFNWPGQRYLCRSHNDLPYFRDWNHLMLAVEKIEEAGYLIQIHTAACQITKRGQLPTQPYFSIGNLSDTKKEAVWFAVFEFTKALK